MEKFNALLSKLKELKLQQSELSWEESLPEEIWNDYFKDNHKTVKSGLDVDKHRWHETSTTVVKIFDKILGINHVSDLFSESMSADDCYHTIQFFEMEEINSISYKAVD